MSDPPRMRIPLDWVVVDAIGALLAAAGVMGLMGSGERFLPILGNPLAAGACLAAGIALMGLALVQILRRMRASAERPPG